MFCVLTARRRRTQRAFASGNGLSPNLDDLAFMPGGDLLVDDNSTGKIQRYNGSTGTFVGTFATVPGVLAAAYGTGGDLFVTPISPDPAPVSTKSFDSTALPAPPKASS